MESARTEVISELLKKYNVDLHRGFLPFPDPLLRLPDRFAAWENLAEQFTDYINAGVIRERIAALPLIDTPVLQSEGEWNRAMMLLSFFAHAYVHAPSDSSPSIPPQIARPWIKVANRLKRKPVLSHASIVLHNWRRLDADKPIQLNNLATLCQFHGGLDESWFYLVTVEIEAVGAKAILPMLQTMLLVREKQYAEAAEVLHSAVPILQSLTTTLQKMYAYCDPHIFYLRIRPFLASLENVEFKGTDFPLQSLHGGSAAQSSLLQFFDAVLGIKYEHESTSIYLRQMRDHMPEKHAAFLSFVEKNAEIANRSAQYQPLTQAYEAAVQALIDFRNEHLKIVAKYIIQPAKKMQRSAKGTGGTNPMVFLKSVRNQNEKLIE